MPPRIVLSSYLKLTSKQRSGELMVHQFSLPIGTFKVCNSKQYKVFLQMTFAYFSSFFLKKWFFFRVELF